MFDGCSIFLRLVSQQSPPPDLTLTVVVGLCDDLKSACCYNNRLFSTWTNMYIFYIYIYICNGGGVRAELLDECWRCLLGHTHTHPLPHTQTRTHRISDFSLKCSLERSVVFTLNVCRLWIRHFMLTSSWLSQNEWKSWMRPHGHVTEGGFWPRYMSVLPINVPCKVPLRQEIPSSLELYGETKRKVDKVSEVV